MVCRKGRQVTKIALNPLETTLCEIINVFNLNATLENSCRIILVFDAHKLDISDEFKHAIEAIRAQDDKIRIILNKVEMIYQCMFITSNKKRNLSSIQADMMTHQQLMRVYGALLWSLSKILGNPEVGGIMYFLYTVAEH